MYQLGWLLLSVVCAAWNFDDESSKNFLDRVARVFAWVVTISNIIFCGGVLLMQDGWQLPRFVGSVGNPLYLAGLLLFMPWAIRRVQNKFVQWAMILMTILVFVGADVRGAWIALAALGASYFLIKNVLDANKRAIIATGVAIVLFLVLAFGAIIKIGVHRTSTIETRLALWQSGLHELRAHPLIGFGLGKHVDIVDRGTLALKTVSYTEISDTTHSGYLDLALAGGVIALGLFIIWIFVALRMCVKNSAWSSDERALAAATLIAYCVFAATSFFSVWLWLPFLFIFPAALRTIANDEQKIFVRVGVCVIGALVFSSAMVLLIYTSYAARYMHTVEDAMLHRKFIELPRDPIFTDATLPYANDYLVAQLRMTLPSTEKAVVPSYEHFVNQNIVPKIQQLARANSRHPQDDFVAATWASAYAGSGLTSSYSEWYARAAVFQEHALAVSPDRPQSIFQLADTYRELGRMPDALSLLDGFVVRHPNFPEGHFFYGIMLNLAEKKDAALAQAREALKLRPLAAWETDRQDWLRTATR